MADATLEVRWRWASNDWKDVCEVKSTTCGLLHYKSRRHVFIKILFLHTATTSGVNVCAKNDFRNQQSTLFQHCAWLMKGLKSVILGLLAYSVANTKKWSDEFKFCWHNNSIQVQKGAIWRQLIMRISLNSVQLLTLLRYPVSTRIPVSSMSQHPKDETENKKWQRHWWWFTGFKNIEWCYLQLVQTLLSCLTFTW